MKNAIIGMAGKLAQSLMFSVLLFFRPFVTGIFGILGAICMLGFLATLVLDRSQYTVLFGFFSTGVLSVGLAFGYNWLVMLMAPRGFAMMME